MEDEEGPRHWGLIAAAVGVVIASLVLARDHGPIYLSGVLLAPVILVVRAVLVRRGASAAAIRRLRSNWGQRVERPREPAALRELYRACMIEPEDSAALDDATWNDLDLDSVFALVDRTLSSAGEYALYDLLRTPSLDPGALAERERRIAAIEADADARGPVREILQHLGRSPIDPLTFALFGETVGEPRSRMALAAQALMPLIGAIVWISVDSTLGALWCFGGLIANAATHFRIKNEIAAAAAGFRYLARLVGSGKRLAATQYADADSGLSGLLDEIGRVAKTAESIRSRGARIGMSEMGSGGDLLQSLYEYISLMFLVEVRDYYAVREQLTELRPDLQRLLRLVGEVDALQSIASWRAGLDRFCRPTFSEDAVELEVDDAVHPLLDEPVPNSFRLGGRSLVVTGSNMSGKSTLLRTIGLSTILAQTLHTVPAERYVACPLRVASSVTIQDDLNTGRSFYLAEAERLLRLLRFAEEEGPALILVDEPLRGTNSTERIAAVSEILLHLAQLGALTVAATHELQIAEIVAATYDSCHLGDEVDEEGLRFPHRIRPGVATSRNAIRLLGKLGYPEALVESAQSRAAEIDVGRSSPAASEQGCDDGGSR